jgi:sphingosine kinase
MPSVTEPLPEEFEKVEGDFMMVHACNTSHCSYNFYSAPSAKLDDGFMHVHYIKNPLSNWKVGAIYKMGRILLGFDDGSFVNRPEVMTIKTKFFRLVPTNTSGIITVDGEEIENEAIQCELMQKTARVFCRAVR